MAPKIGLTANQTVRDKIVRFIENVVHYLMRMYILIVIAFGYVDGNPHAVGSRREDVIFGRKCADFQMYVGIILGQLSTLVCKNMQMVNGLLGQLKVVAEDSLDQPFGLDLELVPENLAIAVVDDVLLMGQRFLQKLGHDEGRLAGAGGGGDDDMVALFPGFILVADQVGYILLCHMGTSFLKYVT